MEDLIWEEELEAEVDTAAECVENKTFGEVIERRYVQIPRGSHRILLSYDEWRDRYERLVKKEDFNKKPEDMIPEWKKERAIKIIWEEGLDELEYKEGIYTTRRPYSPEVKKVIEHHKYVAENFDEIWDELEAEWKKKKEKLELQAAAEENEKEKQPQRYKVDWSKLDGLPEEGGSFGQ